MPSEIGKRSSPIIKKAASFAAFLVLLTTSNAYAADVIVVVKNVKPNSGPVIVALYDKAADFPVPEKRLAVQRAESQGESISVTFKGLGAGKYAVATFQDEKRTGKLDKNFLGIPTEGYGFSNDAQGTMGPPSFEAAAFNPAATPRVVINLH
jgi:uncharacterized protein (DUF2141 family)